MRSLDEANETYAGTPNGIAENRIVAPSRYVQYSVQYFNHHSIEPRGVTFQCFLIADEARKAAERKRDYSDYSNGYSLGQSPLAGLIGVV